MASDLLPSNAENTDTSVTGCTEKALANDLLLKLSQLKPLALHAAQRKQVMSAMRQLVTEQAQILTVADINRLVELCHHLCDWPLLIRMYQYGLWSVPSAQVALLEGQLGFFDKALERLSREASASGKEVEQSIEKIRSSIGYPTKDLRDGQLSLTPLQYYHIADFSWQYADKKIADLCNLPEFTSGDQWLSWLYATQQEKERTAFAIIDDEYGFIGTVTLQLYDGTGFFYYWLGADFQGQGFGPKAVNIILRLARKYDRMRCCFAKVYQCNAASHKAMAKLAFKRLPFTAKPPSANEVFYCYEAEMGLGLLRQKLTKLLEDMNSDIVLNG